MGPKHEAAVPIPFADVRLVIPYELTQHGRKRYSDVVVDKIFMERHTTGIDPYTGTDYGDAKIPESHQYDPQTGLPIFHRYIAGTQNRIEWPWEKEDEIEDSGIAEEDTRDKQTWFRKTMNTVRHPITSLSSWRSQTKESTEASKNAEVSMPSEIEDIEKTEMEKKKTERPRGKTVNLPDAYDDVDTTRNIVEGADSMSYTIIAPPFPDTLGEELRGEIHDFAIEAKKDPEAPRNSVKVKKTSVQSVLAWETAKQKKTAAEKMKTPMQLRWELEHAKKLAQQKKSPLVETDALLAALGQHMQKNGVKVPKTNSRAQEID